MAIFVVISGLLLIIILWVQIQYTLDNHGTTITYHNYYYIVLQAFNIIMQTVRVLMA